MGIKLLFHENLHNGKTNHPVHLVGKRCYFDE